MPRFSECSNGTTENPAGGAWRRERAMLDAITEKLDFDALVVHALAAEHAVRRPEGVGHDRHDRVLDHELAECQGLRLHRADTAVPVTPRSLTGFARSGSPASSTTRCVTAERLAPVSSTSRYGPLPLISTGAQMRPMLSRVLGAT